jgi:hypothetical protein
MRNSAIVMKDRIRSDPRKASAYSLRPRVPIEDV